MNRKKGGVISRREFARRAALAPAVASLGLAKALDGASAAPASQAQSEQPAKLPAESRAEIEARIDAINKQYGKRFSKEQHADIRRLCMLAQPPLERLRAYANENGDSPALYLKPLVERDKKPAAPPRSAKRPTQR
jgi:hypothetical protein